MIIFFPALVDFFGSAGRRHEQLYPGAFVVAMMKCTDINTTDVRNHSAYHLRAASAADLSQFGETAAPVNIRLPDIGSVDLSASRRTLAQPYTCSPVTIRVDLISACSRRPSKSYGGRHFSIQ